jgi:hypothetical protein
VKLFGAMPGIGATGRKRSRKKAAPFSARARRKQSYKRRMDKFRREDQGIEGIDYQ